VCTGDEVTIDVEGRTLNYAAVPSSAAATQQQSGGGGGGGGDRGSAIAVEEALRAKREADGGALRGTLARYVKTVGCASEGACTW
jgi:hypothetical protein